MVTEDEAANKVKDIYEDIKSEKAWHFYFKCQVFSFLDRQIYFLRYGKKP